MDRDVTGHFFSVSAMTDLIAVVLFQLRWNYRFPLFVNFHDVGNNTIQGQYRGGHGSLNKREIKKQGETDLHIIFCYIKAL